MAALGRFDAILCRNVLIYFTDDTARRVVDTLGALACVRAAYLLVGVSESLLRFGTSLRCEERGGAFFYQKAAHETPPIRVLVVDDSAFARKVLRDTLAADRASRSSASRATASRRSRSIAELKPDVVTLDLVMPNLDGLGVLKALPAVGAPRVVIVSMAEVDSALGIAALQRRRRRPRAQADVAGDRSALRPGRRARDQGHRRRRRAIRRPLPDTPVAPIALPRPLGTTKRLLLIGASTGGPQALTRALAAAARGFPRARRHRPAHAARLHGRVCRAA